MKKLFACVLALSIIFAFAACESAPQATEPSMPPATQETGPSTEPSTTQAPTENTPVNTVPENLYSVAMPITEEPAYAEDGTLIFTYSYQTMHLILQDKEVADKIIIDFLSKVETTRSDAEHLRSLAEARDHTAIGFIPYSYQLHFDPMRIDQGVLSMHGHVSQIGEAAHSNTHCMSASYDLVTGDVLTLGSILYHADAKQAISDMVVQELEKQPELNLFEDYKTSVRSRFQRDESIDDDFYFTSTGLCFYFSPYEIAPYASGTITVELPYDRLTGIIADAYFPAERTAASGALNIGSFEDADLSGYSQFAELVITPDATKLLLTATDSVHDVRIKKLYWSEDVQSVMQEKTIFASNGLSQTDAILIDGSFDGAIPLYLVSYVTNGQSMQYYITNIGGQHTLTQVD